MLIDTNELARITCNKQQTKDHTVFSFDLIAEVLTASEYLMIKEIER